MRCVEIVPEIGGGEIKETAQQQIITHIKKEEEPREQRKKKLFS
jgi:hypothetical protein